MEDYVKILVTGGAGFIGSHIAEYYARNGHSVVILDTLRSGTHDNITGFSHKFIQASVTDQSAVITAMKDCTYVFHMAAMTSVPESFHSPDECENINVIGTINILQAALTTGVKKVIIASSASVYGDDPALPKKENMQPHPLSPYAVTKVSSEYYASLFSKEYNLSTVLLRYFNVYGPRQDPDSPYASVIPLFINRAIKNKTIFINGDGQQTRDFIYIDDVVRAITYTAENGNGIYNVATGSCITITDLAEQIIDLTHSSSDIQYRDPRPGDIRHSVASIENIAALGFSPHTNHQNDLLTTIQYFSAQ